MSLFDAFIDGLGNFIGAIIIAIASLLTIPAKVLWNNRKRTLEHREELGLEDEGPPRLEEHEERMAELQEMAARQGRDNQEMRSLIAGTDESDPRDSLFERIDQIEDKVDDLHDD